MLTLLILIGSLVSTNFANDIFSGSKNPLRVIIFLAALDMITFLIGFRIACKLYEGF